MSQYNVESNFSSVNKDNPFGDDLLSDGAWIQLADSLADLLGQDADSLVLSIEAPWGSGKTHFLNRLSSYLQSKKSSFKIKILRINAWENDYAPDPIEVLIYHFAKAFPSAISDGEFAKKVEVVLKNMIIGAVDHASEKAFGFKTSTGDMAKDVDDRGEFYKRLARFKEFEEGKWKLAEIIETHLKRSNEIGIIIIDELDRCHPRFAIEFLERVKHFFSIPRLKFIFGVDYIQLCNLAKGAFGVEIDTVNYLNRFFNIRVQLPVRSQGAFTIIYQKFENILYGGKKTGLSREVTLFCNLINKFELTIRQKQLLASKLATAMKYNHGIEFSHWPVIALILFLEEKRPGISHLIFSQNIPQEELLNEIAGLLLRQLPLDISNDSESLDGFFIPDLLAMLFSKKFAAEAISDLINNPTRFEFTHGNNLERLATWHSKLIDPKLSWSRLDKSVFARATTLASSFRL